MEETKNCNDKKMNLNKVLYASVTKIRAHTLIQEIYCVIMLSDS